MNQDQGQTGQTQDKKKTQSGKKPGYLSGNYSTHGPAIQSKDLKKDLFDWCGCKPENLTPGEIIRFGPSGNFEVWTAKDEKYCSTHLGRKCPAH